MPDQRVYNTDALVLGAGLAGSCVALALASAGRRVTLLDRAGSAMRGASGNTEGKIHLGYVYALDEGLSTQRRMLTGALTFGPLLDRWLGPQRWDEVRTPRFRYAVMPDSLLDADALESRYRRQHRVLDAARADAEEVVQAPATYLGRPFTGRIRRTPGDASGPMVDGRCVDAVFETEEAAVDPDRVNDTVRRALDRSDVDLRLLTEVHEARRHGYGFAVAAAEPDGVTAWWRAAVVVNCLWEDRVRIDASVGIQPTLDWTYRVKHLVVVKLRPDAHAPTVTMVQGPYGDVISWDAARVCLSWYPIARTTLRTIALSEVGQPPLRAGEPTQTMVGEILTAMARMFHSLRGARVVDVRGGVIVAPGTSDIDDPDSQLHVRSNPAVHEHDGWWTVDTGKYSLAPLLADLASRQIDAALRS